MEHSLLPGEAPETGLPRLLSSVLSEVEDHLSVELLAQPPEVQDGHVHALRKRLKEARAWLRLARPHLPRPRFEALDQRLRALGQATGPARDATVVAALVAELGAPAPPADAARELWRAEVIAPLRAEAVALSGTLGALDLDGGQGADLLEAGLRRTWGRCAERREAALSTGAARPDAEALHDWRKSVKRARDQLRLVQGAWPGVLAGLEAELNRLGEVLGEHHDLHVASALVDLGPDGSASLDRRARALEAEAAVLGTRLFTLAAPAFSRWVVAVVGVWAPDPTPSLR